MKQETGGYQVSAVARAGAGARVWSGAKAGTGPSWPGAPSALA